MQLTIGLRQFALPPVTRLLRHGMAFITEMSRVRQGRRAIAQMDARMLADIGLSRTDAQEEVSRRPWDVRPRG